MHSERCRTTLDNHVAKHALIIKRPQSNPEPSQQLQLIKALQDLHASLGDAADTGSIS